MDETGWTSGDLDEPIALLAPKPDYLDRSLDHKAPGVRFESQAPSSLTVTAAMAVVALDTTCKDIYAMRFSRVADLSVVVA